MPLAPVCFFKMPSGFDLSSYSGDSPFYAYSLRRLNSGYSGPLVRLRRSSDSVEQNFGSGLALGAFLNYAAIDSWLGGSSGFITTWYDQSGQGHNAVQTASANQPELKTGAGFGRGVYFASTGDWLYAEPGHAALSSGPAASIHIALDSTYTPFSTLAAITVAPTTPGGITYMRINRYDTSTRFVWRSDTNVNTIVAALAGREYLYAHHDTTNIRLDRNATEVDSNANTTAMGAAGDTLCLGSDAGSNNWQGYLYEVIIFNASQNNVNSNAIRTNMNSTYTLY